MRRLSIPFLLALPAAAAAATIADATLSEPGATTLEISTAELRAILAEGTAVVFDARPPREFALGHIPGARNVGGKPGVAMSQDVSDVGALERAVRGDKATPIVLYCARAPSCP